MKKNKDEPNMKSYKIESFRDTKEAFFSETSSDKCMETSNTVWEDLFNFLL
jgi:hypothetical protein